MYNQTGITEPVSDICNDDAAYLGTQLDFALSFGEGRLLWCFACVWLECSACCSDRTSSSGLFLRMMSSACVVSSVAPSPAALYMLLAWLCSTCCWYCCCTRLSFSPGPYASAPFRALFRPSTTAAVSLTNFFIVQLCVIETRVRECERFNFTSKSTKCFQKKTYIVVLLFFRRMKIITLLDKKNRRRRRRF